MIALPSEASLAAALELARERGELFLLYQPKIDSRSGELSGVEALMRWRSRELGLVLPSLFIPVAEQCGAIDDLTEWAFGEACREWSGWCDQGLKIGLAVNVSALTLRNPTFPDQVSRCCLTHGVPPELLTIEVTEGAAQHAVRLLDTITRFRISGVRVELDDFGTGYSSLLQLRQLPYTGLKIDLGFVQDAVAHRDARLIVTTIITLAHGLGLTVTAEGVEDDQTLDLLRELGCDCIQGYLVAPPLMARDLVPWVLQSGHQWRTLLGEAAPVPSPGQMRSRTRALIEKASNVISLSGRTLLPSLPSHGFS